MAAGNSGQRVFHGSCSFIYFFLETLDFHSAGIISTAAGQVLVYLTDQRDIKSIFIFDIENLLSWHGF